MGYDRGDSFPFDFEPDGIPFGSENKKENCHHDHIPFNVKGNGNIVFSVQNSQWGGNCVKLPLINGPLIATSFSQLASVRTKFSHLNSIIRYRKCDWVKLYSLISPIIDTL